MRLVVKPHPASAPDALHVARTAIRIAARPMRVLDVDIENRPLSYLGSDFTTAEVTAVAWAWTDAPEKVWVYLLGETPVRTILRRFVRAWDQADIVTGHYFRGHDAPMLNGALMELGLPALSDKFISDTKLDLMRSKGISLSQESLGAMFRLEQPKVTMNQFKWRSANRLTKEGRAWVRERVTGDVRQHIEMRQRLLDLGYLAAPRIWRSGSAKAESYIA